MGRARSDGPVSCSPLALEKKLLCSSCLVCILLMLTTSWAAGVTVPFLAVSLLRFGDKGLPKPVCLRCEQRYPRGLACSEALPAVSPSTVPGTCGRSCSPPACFLYPKPSTQHPYPARSSVLMLLSAALSAAARDELVCSSLCWAWPAPAAPMLSGLGGGMGRGPTRGASFGPENASWVQATDTGLGVVPMGTNRLVCASAGLDMTLCAPPHRPQHLTCSRHLE